MIWLWWHDVKRPRPPLQHIPSNICPYSDATSGEKCRAETPLSATHKGRLRLLTKCVRAWRKGKRTAMILRRLLIGLICGYQRILSPLLPPSCRFYPSCSEYAIQALRMYGLWFGLAKAAWRLLRCHPWSRGGVDWPTPPSRHGI